MTRILDTLAITVASWSLLLLGAISAEALDPAWTVFGSFLAATLLLLVTRTACARRRTPPTLWAVGLVAGFASYPLWVWAISRVGLAAGLAAAPAATQPEGLLALAALLGFGPLFEELLYRERMLDALASVDVPRGVRWIVTSLLFAIPHLQPWSILGTFLVGLALAITYESTRCLGFCVALHVGLNLATVSPSPAAGRILLFPLAVAAFASGLRMARRTPLGTTDALASA